MQNTIFKRSLLSISAALTLGVMLLIAGCNNTPQGPGNGDGGNDGPLISNVNATSDATYQVTDLSTGVKVYTDRDYTYLDVPSVYDGAAYIQTANDDKSASDESFLTFGLARDATVAVLYDKRLSRPSWLSKSKGWVDTGVNAKSESVGVPLYSRIYEKTFSAGTVELSGNGSGDSGSMYAVAAIEGQGLGEGDGGGGGPTGSVPEPGGGDFYSSGTTLYVSTSGSDDAGDGSQSNPYATPQKAQDEAKRGDTIKIKGGTYNGEAEANMVIKKSNLHFIGYDGQPHMKLQDSDRPTYSKGVWLIGGGADSTTIENIEFSGASIGCDDPKGCNAAGIRIDASGVNGVTLRNLYIHDNQMGILSDVPEGSRVLVENCEFARNGTGSGYSHNSYFSGRGILTFRYNYTHDANNGNIFKSRMSTNYILYNTFADGTDSNYMGNYNIDIPNGGVAYVIGNVLQQASYTDNTVVNTDLLEYGKEGARYAENALFVVNNTFVNEFTGGGKSLALASLSGLEVVNKNNIFAGSGSVGDGQSYTTSSNNFKGNPGFANAGNLDYHLTSGSTDAIDQGTDPGDSKYGYSLTPMMEYVQTAQSQQRTVNGGAIDIGAFEY